MQLGYSPLLEVNCRLESFAGRPLFSFAPLAGTGRELARHAMLFRPTDQGFMLLYQARHDEATDTYIPLRPLPVGVKLGFSLSCSVSLIQHIARVPFFKPGREIFYFDNLTSRKDGDTLFLNAEAPAKKFVSQTDLHSVRSPIWKFSQPGDTASFMNLADARGRIVAGSICDPIGPPGDRKISFTVDLSTSIAGLYELLMEGESMEKFYLFADRGTIGLGIIDLYSGPEVPTDCAFIDPAGQPSPKVFSLAFEKRTTTWRYHVIPKYDQALLSSSLAIVDPKGRYTFTAPDERTTITGEKAYVIQSIEDVPVTEEVVDGIRLEIDHKPRISNLKNPEYTAVTVENNTFFSDVYVYV